MGPFIEAFDISYSKAVTPSDVTDNIAGCRYLHNNGTAGAMVIAQDQGYPDFTLYLTQGQTVPAGRLWKRVNATGLGAGVALVAHY